MAAVVPVHETARARTQHGSVGRRLAGNVGLTTSVENQEAADERMPLLQATSARLLCLSVEPLLGPIDFSRYDLSRVGWAMVGGESGAHARPMHPQWARDACPGAYRGRRPVWFKLVCTNSRPSAVGAAKGRLVLAA